MPASLASFSTSSQPSSTIGRDNDRVDALVDEAAHSRDLGSGLLSAALKMSSKPFASEKAVFIDSVLAARQPLSNRSAQSQQ